MMTICCALLGLIGSVSLLQASEDPRLDGILHAFDQREARNGAQEAHEEWIASEAGKADLTYLTEHYDQLTLQRRDEVPMELARSGALAVVPLIKKALADSAGQGVVTGIYFAIRLNKPEPGFNKEVMAALLPLLEKNGTVLELFPTLDPEMAKATLLTDAWISPDSTRAREVVIAFNQAGVALPIERLRPLLAAWKKPTDAGKKWDLRRYGEVLVALARLESTEAIAKADECVASDPAQSDSVADVYLAAAGLGTLSDKLGDLINWSNDQIKVERNLSKLPKPAQLYFAVGYFDADWMNGGLSQALSNTTGNLLPLAREGYKEIGDEVALQYLERACATFGPDGPSTDRGKRNDQMEQMKPSFYDREKAWDNEPDSEISRKPHVPTAVLLNRYAARHADVLKPLLSKP